MIATSQHIPKHPPRCHLGCMCPGGFPENMSLKILVGAICNPDNLSTILKSAAGQGFKLPSSSSSMVDICKFESEHFLVQINAYNKDIIRNHYRAVFFPNCCL